MPSLLRSVASQIARTRITSSPTLRIRSASALRTSHEQSPSLRPRPSTFSSPLRTSLNRHFATTSPSSSSSVTPMAAETDATAASLASSNDINPDTLSSKLRTQLNLTHVDIQDMSGGCGQAFTAVIVSPDFEKKTLLARHRLVNGALKNEIAAIHAWTPRCLTPAQWDAEREKERGTA